MCCPCVGPRRSRERGTAAEHRARQAVREGQAAVAQLSGKELGEERREAEGTERYSDGRVAEEDLAGRAPLTNQNAGTVSRPRRARRQSTTGRRPTRSVSRPNTGARIEPNSRPSSAPTEGARQRDPSRARDEIRQEDEEDVERQAHRCDDTEADGHLARRRAQRLTHGRRRDRSPCAGRHGTQVSPRAGAECRAPPARAAVPPGTGVAIPSSAVPTLTAWSSGRPRRRGRPPGRGRRWRTANRRTSRGDRPVMLHDERGRPALLPADRRALAGAQREEQDGCQPADRVVARASTRCRR